MLNAIIDGFERTGTIAEDVPRFLNRLEHQRIAKHCEAVAHRAKELAKRFASDPVKAERAGYLHDIGKVIPNEKQVEFARSQTIEVLAEEMQCPMLIHQKLSVVVARDVFGVTDREILSAIDCHTTLKAKATRLDKVVFLADKIVWVQIEKPPYLSKVIKAMDVSLDAAILEYMNYLWERREQIQVIHPWFREAREDLLKMS